MPAPLFECFLAEHLPSLACQRTDHLHWQTIPRSAGSCGARTTWTQTISRALRRPAVDRLLARAITLQHLRHEHRQCHRRWIKPFAMHRQKRFCCFKQICAGQYRDRKKPYGPSLPHHRTYGSRIRQFRETSLFSCCPGRCQLGQPHLTKQLCRHCQMQGWRFAQSPWPMRALACVPSLTHVDPAFSEVSR